MSISFSEKDIKELQLGDGKHGTRKGITQFLYPAAWQSKKKYKTCYFQGALYQRRRSYLYLHLVGETKKIQIAGLREVQYGYKEYFIVSFDVVFPDLIQKREGSAAKSVFSIAYPEPPQPDSMENDLSYFPS